MATKYENGSKKEVITHPDSEVAVIPFRHHEDTVAPMVIDRRLPIRETTFAVAKPVVESKPSHVPKIESNATTLRGRIGEWLRGALPLPEWWDSRKEDIDNFISKFDDWNFGERIFAVAPLVLFALLIIPVPGPWSAIINAAAAAMVFGKPGAEWATRFSMTFLIQPSVWVLKNGFRLLEWIALLGKRPFEYYPLVNR